MTNEEAQIVIGNIPLKPEVLDDCYSITEYQEAKAMAIEALEHTRWIPVSERLPEVGEKVLCQCQAKIYEVLKLTVDGWYHDNNHCYMSGFVIAWMPLPQPYIEGSDEE